MQDRIPTTEELHSILEKEKTKRTVAIWQTIGNFIGKSGIILLACFIGYQWAYSIRHMANKQTESVVAMSESMSRFADILEGATVETEIDYGSHDNVDVNQFGSGVNIVNNHSSQSIGGSIIHGPDSQNPTRMDEKDKEESPVRREKSTKPKLQKIPNESE